MQNYQKYYQKKFADDIKSRKIEQEDYKRNKHLN